MLFLRLYCEILIKQKHTMYEIKLCIIQSVEPSYSMPSSTRFRDRTVRD